MYLKRKLDHFKRERDGISEEETPSLGKGFHTNMKKGRRKE